MKKTVVLTMRVSQEEMDEFKRISKLNGIPLSALIRTFVKEGMSSFDPKHVQLVAKFESANLHLAALNKQVEDLQEMLAVNTALSASTSTADFEKVKPHVIAAKELADFVRDQFTPALPKKGK